MDDRNPTSDRLRRLASRYEAGVGRGRAEQIAARAITRAHRRTSVGRRLAVAVSSGAFMLVSMTGVGVAADRALPGDFLYPLDRALEAVGLSSDLVEERLLEAIALADRGDMALAVDTANQALEELGRSGVTATLPAPAEVPTTSDASVGATVAADEPSTTTTEDEPISSTAATATTSTEPQELADESAAPVVEAAEQPVDAVEALRLAAEQLLQSVRSAKVDGSGDVTTAALFLAETTAGATTDEQTAETTSSTTSSTSTSSTTSTSTTSTTLAEEADPADGNDPDNGTTTTTVTSEPNDGSGSDDSTGDGQGDSPGPIFLPAP